MIPPALVDQSVLQEVTVGVGFRTFIALPGETAVLAVDKISE